MSDRFTEICLIGRVLKWGQLYAAGTVLLVPVFVFTVTMQKFLVHGITAGGVKG